MNRTTENLLTWAPLGAGIAFILSDHRRIGLAMASVSQITVAMQHPRATRRALKAVPKALKTSGLASGKAFHQAGKKAGWSFKGAGKGLRWLAS